MIAKAREVAARLLTRLSAFQATLDDLYQDPAVNRLDERDRRLVTELLYGVLRRRGEMDFYIEALAGRPLKRIDPEVLSILRLALYQLEYLRVPDHAAVHSAVELCRTLRKSSARSFVNALLRRFLKEKPPLPDGDDPHSLAVRYSHPEWLVARYWQRYGSAAARGMLENNNCPPPGTVWINPFRTDPDGFCRLLEAEGIAYRRLPGLEPALQIDAPGFSQHRFCREGWCAFMDASSQWVAWQAGVSGRHWIGDLCAAPGGKSFILASRMEAAAVLICGDSNARRLREMRDRARTFRVPIEHWVQANLEAGAPFAGRFDLVLLDVPCSGLGTLGSNPDIRWKIRPEDLTGFQERQKRILASGWKSLAANGELLYSTCSTEPEENEEVVEGFLAAHPEGYRLVPDQRTFPATTPGDAFYVARLGREG